MAKESPEQKAVRRAISAWLTKRINNVDATAGTAYPGIRAAVLEALQEIHLRIIELNRSLQDQYYLKPTTDTDPDRDLVKFYMKGGNAFECIRDAQGAAATQFGGGDSDWDTQVIIDPWAPLPLQSIVYGLVEELVTDTLIEAGVEIAKVADDFVATQKNLWALQRGNLDGVNYSLYDLAYDKPQTLRQIFDRERLGLWTNDRRKVSDPDIDHPDRIPGIVLNDAIRPFQLYRLGYTWHAELQRQTQQPQPPPLNVGVVAKPELMELIDVTLPRRDTIEAVAVWEELQQKHIEVAETGITVTNVPQDGGFDDVDVELPLPDIMYHLREIATMLCEIADGSSRHPDKLNKRFQRFKVIWDSSDATRRQKIREALSAFTGVADITRNVPNHVDSVTSAIDHYGGSIRQAILADNELAYVLARSMMDRIAIAAAAEGQYFDRAGTVTGATLSAFDQARGELGHWTNSIVSARLRELTQGRMAAAFSDDLALVKFVRENGYLDAQRIGFSGVLKAMVIRVDNHTDFNLATALFHAALDPRYSEASQPAPATTLRFRNYSTPRPTGIALEETMVVFSQGKAFAYITVTTAEEEEAPFRADPDNKAISFASLPEIALQRKVAAALIEDYIIRKVISRQYEALKTLLPVV